MQRLEVSGAVRPIYGSLGVKRLSRNRGHMYNNVFSSRLLVKTVVFLVFKPRQNME